LLLVPAAAWAQDTLESRLREALRQTTANLHSTQDQLDARQAELAMAKATVDALTRENADLKARLDAAKPSATAPGALKPDDAALGALRAELSAATSRNAALQGQIAAAAAATKASMDEAQARVTAITKDFGSLRGLVNACRQTNDKLVAVANEILNTYKSQDFRSVWLKSYEPVLGFDRIRLENIMQGFQDKILDQTLPPGGTISGAVSP